MCFEWGYAHEPHGFSHFSPEAPYFLKRLCTFEHYVHSLNRMNFLNFVFLYLENQLPTSWRQKTCFYAFPRRYGSLLRKEG